MRHARYIYSLGDYQKQKNGPMPSPEGLKETKAFAKQLARRKFAAIYANTANRSKIAARIIAEENANHPRVIIDRRIDPMKVDYTGKDIISHVKNAKTRSRTGERWVGGELPSIEPLPDFMARVGGFLLSCAAENAGKGDILVVAHWETFAVADAMMHGTPLKKAMKAHDAFKYNKLYAFDVS
jgi:broad specificity phosphatase PhoE